MDDWALATVADLEDRTRVRGVSGAVSAVNSRKRRRRVAAVQGEYSPVGTLLRQSNSAPYPRSTATRATQRPRSMQVLQWVLVGCAALVIALAAVATLVIIRSTSGEIPVVSDIQAEAVGESVEFSWPDPGISNEDSYQVEVNGSALSVQRTASFAYTAEPGERVCLIVTVNHEGKLGAPSAQKCVDVAD